MLTKGTFVGIHTRSQLTANNQSTQALAQEHLRTISPNRPMPNDSHRSAQAANLKLYNKFSLQLDHTFIRPTAIRHVVGEQRDI